MRGTIGILCVALAACRGPSLQEREALDDATYDPAVRDAAPAAEGTGTGAGTLGPPTTEPAPSPLEGATTREGSAGPPIRPYSPLEEPAPVEGAEPMAPAE